MSPDLAFCIHHVGARYGNHPFPVPEGLADGLAVVLYDADGDSRDGVVSRETKFVAAALADHDGSADFRISINAAASSLLEPSDAPRGFIQPMLGIDWDVERCAAVVERRKLRTRTLDSLLTDSVSIPAPDFLSLDTQGSEFSIIRGAENTIRSRVVGLIVEVEFIELYRGVPGFDQVARKLADLGFHFVRFTDFIEAESSAQPLGRRSRGFAVAADALFLRRVDSIAKKTLVEQSDQLLRLAFASVVFGHMGHAFSALERVDWASISTISGWSASMRAIWEAAASLKRIFPPVFPDILPEIAITAFREEADVSNWPSYFNFESWRRSTCLSDRELASVLDALVDKSETPLESALRRYGFDAAADHVCLARRDQAHKLSLLLNASAMPRA